MLLLLHFCKSITDFEFMSEISEKRGEKGKPLMSCYCKLKKFAACFCTLKMWLYGSSGERNTQTEACTYISTIPHKPGAIAIVATSTSEPNFKIHAYPYSNCIILVTASQLLSGTQHSYISTHYIFIHVKKKKKALKGTMEKNDNYIQLL